MFYSPTTGGFYIEGFNFDVPNDAVEISPEKYEELKHGLALGLVVLIGDDGVPVAAPPSLTIEGVAIMERAWRDEVISRTDYLAMPDYPLTEDARAQLLDYRQQLRDWPSMGAFPSQESRPEPPPWLEGSLS
ncbi:tail fiber assembly protein [Pseudomonas guariconensis]|uniref:tail fiber assembly protein n=1 Tax=Pseudomonas guariconensis TaxID=1288410 RepID=UPI002B05E00C|nr:tail fiber assembly protein [Pseudomonas guariconensis]